MPDFEIRVLVVDDDAQLRKLFRRILESGGLAVVEAAAVNHARIYQRKRSGALLRPSGMIESLLPLLNMIMDEPVVDSTG